MPSPADFPPTRVPAWLTKAREELGLQLFALVDPATDGTLIGLISRTGLNSTCLFGYDIEAPIACKTPRLVECVGSQSNEFLEQLLERLPRSPCATLIGAYCGLDELARHLREVIDVELVDVDSMFLAVWDPAILGTLMGTRQDATLHVQGPVLNPSQTLRLLGPVRYWWYWDRDGNAHDAASTDDTVEQTRTSIDLAPLPLQLAPTQIDMLVEASVPDHILHHIRLNQPDLVDKVAPAHRYRFVRQQLSRARSYGLVGMNDLVNYVCVALAFGSRFDEVPSMAKLLNSIKDVNSSFADLLEQAVESDLELSATEPTLI